MDLLIWIKDTFIAFTHDLNPHISLFIIRISFLLLLSYILLWASWLFIPLRSVFIQVSMLLIGIVITLNLPLGWLRNNQGFFAFLFLFSIICLIFLPKGIPFLLTPRYGTQVKLRTILYSLIVLLFLVQIIVG